MKASIMIITFDVAHGNCHLICTPSGRRVMIDLGRSDDFAPLDWFERNVGKHLDLLVFTHPHDDHIRGLLDLMQKDIQVDIICCPRSVPAELTAQLDPDLKKAWEDFSARFTTPVRLEDKFYDPQSPAFDGMALRFFGGKSDTQNLNNYSIVTVLEFDAFKMIFPGDLEAAGWKALLEQKDFLNAIAGTTLLVAAHHGREKGWCAELFDCISPKLVIIPDGAATETSYASYYSQKAEGWVVRSLATNEAKERKVLSTRDNGCILVKVLRKAYGLIMDVIVEHH